MKLKIAISPCPNDTYIFWALATGELKLDGELANYKPEFHFHDVETLNQYALERRYDITKLSFHAYLSARHRYNLLRTGAALGFGCGPIVVARQSFDINAESQPSIAIPGELTTAHLLFKLWAPTVETRNENVFGKKIFTSFEKVIEMVTSEETDLGILIHEERFVYEKAGLKKVVDLGNWWEMKTNAAIPLGGVAIANDLPKNLATDFDNAVRKSISMAQKNPTSVLPYIRKYAQEMDEKVLEQHIKMFVNDYSFDLGDVGDKAVNKLEQLATKAGIV